MMSCLRWPWPVIFDLNNRISLLRSMCSYRMPATTLGEAGKARASGGIKGGSVQTVNEYVGWQEGTQCSCNTVVKSLAWPAGYSCKQQSPVTGGDASEWEEDGAMGERVPDMDHGGGGRGHSRQREPREHGCGGRKMWDAWNLRVTQRDCSIEGHGPAGRWESRDVETGRRESWTPRWGTWTSFVKSGQWKVPSTEMETGKWALWLLEVELHPCSNIHMLKSNPSASLNVALSGDRGLTEVTSQSKVTGVGPNPVWLVLLLKGEIWARR